MGIEILGKLFDIETMAQGRGIRELDRLPGGRVVTAEVHWYEAHGVGRKEFKLKRIVGDRS